jgi:hypothetical protein
MQYLTIFLRLRCFSAFSGTIYWSEGVRSCAKVAASCKSTRSPQLHVSMHPAGSSLRAALWPAMRSGTCGSCGVVGLLYIESERLRARGEVAASASSLCSLYHVPSVPWRIGQALLRKERGAGAGPLHGLD